jgi:hypothetical protein
VTSGVNFDDRVSTGPALRRAALAKKRRAKRRVLSGRQIKDATAVLLATIATVRSDSLLERRGFELPVLFALNIFREGL